MRRRRVGILLPRRRRIPAEVVQGALDVQPCHHCEAPEPLGRQEELGRRGRQTGRLEPEQARIHGGGEPAQERRVRRLAGVQYEEYHLQQKDPLLELLLPPSVRKALGTD